MKKIVLFLSISFAAGLLFINIYNSIVDAQSWGADIPKSIQAAREYFKSVNPGDFYRIFSPLSQILALISIIFFWKASKQVRYFLIIAFILYVLTDVFTFAYFYPRNTIIFGSPLTQNLEPVKTAWSEWSFMNWIRSLVILTGLVFSFSALNSYYKTNTGK